MTTTVTVSVEIELAWGHHDQGADLNSVLSAGRTAETRALERLLARCEGLAVPVTFDIVGHLLEDGCTGIHDGPHPEGWFDADPGTDVATDPHFYAPDLAVRIDEVDTPHEICTHTYSHVLCGEVEPAVVDWELSEATQCHLKRGIAAPRSLVPPRHSEPPPDVCRSHGIDVIRRTFDGYTGAPTGKVGTFLWALTRAHPTGVTEQEDGLTTTRCTPHPSLTADFLPSGQQPPHAAYRAVPERIRQRIHLGYLRSALAHAIETDTPLHLWTHLYNMANDAQWGPIWSFLEAVAESRDAGDIRVATMAALSAPSREA